MRTLLQEGTFFAVLRLDKKQGETGPPVCLPLEGNMEESSSPSVVAESSAKNHNRRVVRWTLWFAGTVFVGIGILGIFLPLLPTTVFFLMAAWCYARSSHKFYLWMHQNKYFGKYVKDYREGRGVTRTSKAVSIIILWTTILSSALFATDSLAVRIVLVVIAVGVTIHLILVPTAKSS